MNIRRPLPILLAAFGMFFFSCLGPDGPELDPITISGTVLCYNGSPMEGVTIQISTDLNQIIVETDVNGFYSVEDLESGLDYNVKAFYSDGTFLDAEDQELLKDYVLGGATNFDDLQLLMVDFDQSGIVSFQSYSEMEDLILNQVPTPWRFATADYEGPSPGNPDGVGQVDDINVLGPELDVELDLFGVKLGDLNGSSCN